MNLPEKHCWAQIDMDAIAHNFNYIKETFEKPFYVVLKADAYGHGARYLAKVYEEMGAFGIAVSSFGEAMEIRSTGVKIPILILGYTNPALASQLSQNQISQCVAGLDYAKQLSQNALYPVDCHLKIDTGMGRIGFDVMGNKKKAFEEMRSLQDLPCLHFTGLFSHFPVADELNEKAVNYTQKQIDLFCETYNYLTRNGFNFRFVHGQNSAAILRKLGNVFNTQRAGIILYGENPSKELAGCDLKPTMEVKTIVTFVKTVKEGQFAGYGMCFEAKRETRLATIAIGYADGLPRSLNNRGHFVNIKGEDYPIVAICMDQCIVDVTGGDIAVGDEVVAMGGVGKSSFDEIAQKTGTINYEIMCGIQRRVPRVYIKDGKIVKIETNM